MDVMGQIGTLDFIEWLKSKERDGRLKHLIVNGDQNSSKFKFLLQNGRNFEGEVGDEEEIFSARLDDYYVSHEMAYSAEDRSALLLEMKELCNALIEGKYSEKLYVRGDDILKRAIDVDSANKYLILEPRKVSVKARMLIFLKRYEIQAK